MKKYNGKKKAAVLMISTLAAMMILAGSALADESASGSTAADAGTVQVISAATGEERGPGVGADYEELVRKAAERAAAKAAAKIAEKAQERGPGVAVQEAANGAAGAEGQNAGAEAGAVGAEGQPAGPGAAGAEGQPAGTVGTEGQPAGPGTVEAGNQPKGPGTAGPGSKPAGPGEVGPGVSGPGVAEEQAADDRVIDPAKPMVALTIDDGPYAPVGNRILDCLAQHGAKATFYMVGNRCSSYVEEMQRIAADGHELGNHTYSHKYLTKLGAEGIQSEIQRGVEAIQSTSGVAPATVRLPGGLKNATVLANVHAPMIMWSIDTLDWKTKDAQSTVDAVLNKVQDGDIILIHELYQSTADAVVQLVPALMERGYQLVTVSEMATYRGGLENGKIYRHFRPEQ